MEQRTFRKYVKKQLVGYLSPKLRTRGSWVQVLPGAPEFKDLAVKTKSSYLLWDRCGPLIHRSARSRLNSSTWPAKPGPPFLLWDPVGTLIHTSPLAVGDT